MTVPTRFSVEMICGMPVIQAPAELDISNAELLRAALFSAADHGHVTLVVDLTQTEFCDSAALGVLVRGHKRMTAEGGELRLVIQSASLLRIFSVTGVDRVIPMFDALDEAVSELPAIAIRPQPGEPAGSADWTRLTG
jgi:anti-sigma B factor antagonist